MVQRIYLKKNNYQNHAKWSEDFDFWRNNQFNLIGSKDETMGNQNCVASINDDETINLKIRVPNSLESKYGKYVTLNNIALHHGKDEILKVLRDNIRRNYLSKKSSQIEHGQLYKQYGKALNYKFIIEDNALKINITVTSEEPPKVSMQDLGSI